MMMTLLIMAAFAIAFGGGWFILNKALDLRGPQPKKKHTGTKPVWKRPLFQSRKESVPPEQPVRQIRFF